MLHISGHPFTEPKVIGAWKGPDIPAIFAIYSRDETLCASALKLVFLGEIDSLARPGFPKSNTQYGDWLRCVGCAGALYLSYMPMPGSDSAARRDVAQGLIHDLGPVCNRC